MMLQLKKVTKQFTLHHQHGIQLNVLNNVDMSISAGECVVLDGPSGMGKSTLLKLIYANYRVTSGEIEVRQADGSLLELTKADPRELIRMRRDSVGYVSQFLRIIPRVSALDVVAEPLLEDAEGDMDAILEARAQASTLLTRLRIQEKLWELPPATFSGGEQQRINIARNMIKHKSILLLDEPTASLDEENSQTVIDLIYEAINRGTAVVGIFHDSNVANAVATRHIDVMQFRK
jgi:alpha-D-ribose 1-methylphosphonate 5-triphosphate synthase subunit PhnL